MKYSNLLKVKDQKYVLIALLENSYKNGKKNVY